MTNVAGHLSVEELEARYETASETIAKSHFHAIWLLALGHLVPQVAKLLSFSTRWVKALVARYNAGGPSLRRPARRKRDRETILMSQALSAPKQRIKTPPDDGGLWTGAEGRAVVGEVSRRQVCSRPARLRRAGRHWLVDPATASAPSGRRGRGGTRGVQKNSRTRSKRSKQRIRTPKSRSGRATSIVSD